MRLTFAVRASVLTTKRPSSRPNQTGVGTAVPSLRNVTSTAYFLPSQPEKSVALQGCSAASNAFLCRQRS